MLKLLIKSLPNKLLLMLLLINILVSYLAFLEVISFSKRIKFSMEPQYYGLDEASFAVSDYDKLDIGESKFYTVYGGLDERVGVLLHADGFIGLSKRQCAVHPDAGIKLNDIVVYNEIEYTVSQIYASNFEVIIPSYEVQDAEVTGVYFIGKSFSDRRTIIKELSATFGDVAITVPEKVTYLEFLVKTPIMLGLLLLCSASLLILAFCANFLIAKSDKTFAILRLVGYAPKHFIRFYILRITLLFLPFCLFGSGVFLLIERYILQSADVIIGSYHLIFADYFYTVLLFISVFALVNLKGIRAIFGRKIEVARWE